MPKEGMMNSNKYNDIMKKSFQIRKGYFLMMEKYSSRILPHAICPKKMKTIFRKYKSNVLEWSGRSPDLNPVCGNNKILVIKTGLHNHDRNNRSHYSRKISRHSKSKKLSKTTRFNDEATEGSGKKQRRPCLSLKLKVS